MIVDVKLASPGDVGFICAMRATEPFVAGLQGHDVAKDELLPVAGIEIQPAMRFPFARKVTVDWTVTLRLIVVVPR